MNLRISITEDVEPVEHEIRRIFATKTAQAAYAGPWFELLWTTAASRALGGKYVRPKLFLSALNSFTGYSPVENPEGLRIAAAIELLHYSFLLHDDVIDGDTVRRGKPNLIGELASTPYPELEGLTAERRMHWARSCAILMGNLLLAEVHQIAASLDMDRVSRERFLELLDHTITESVIGEQLDVGLSDSIIPAELSTILSMCAYKTATYTFELPLRAAAIVSKADRALDPVLAQAGHLIGLAFQLQDDLLSIFVDAETHGKDAFSDLREGKETALIAYTRMTSAWGDVSVLFRKPDLTHEEGYVTKELLETCGAKAFVESLIEDQIRALHELLAEHQALLPPGLTRMLLTLASDLEGRTS